MGNCSSGSNRPPNRNNKKNTNKDYTKKPMRDWSVQEVYSWLLEAVDGELASTAIKFKKAKINGTQLLDLTPQDLNKLGISPDHQRRLKIFIQSRLRLEIKHHDGGFGKGTGPGQLKMNQHFSPTSNNINRTKQQNILNDNDLEQIAEDSVNEILQGYTCTDNSGNNKSSQQQQSSNNNNSNNTSNTTTGNVSSNYYCANGNYNGSGGIGSSGGSGGGRPPRRNNDEKKNEDWTTDGIKSDDEDDDGDLSASTSTLNPYAKSYYLDTVNEECSDDRVIALKQLFGGYGLGTYDLKYYNKVLDEAQGLLKDLEKNGHDHGSGNISRNLRQNKKVKASRKTGRKNIFFSYGPIKQKDAANQFQIVKKLTKNIIPNLVCENMIDFYSYVHKCISLQKYYGGKGIYSDGEIFVINLDLHGKNDKILYGIAHNVHNIKGYSWKMDNILKTEDEIEKEYKISDDKWTETRSMRESEMWKMQIKNKSYIEKCLDINGMNKIIKTTHWHKMNVFCKRDKKFNKDRTIKCITKNEFQKRLGIYMLDGKNKIYDLIPIIMFNNANENELYYEIHYVWIINIEIDLSINIGISFKYNNKKQCIEVTGIHLDKDLMYEQHQLVNPCHMNECKCFDNFESNITKLEIGNCDAKDNLIKQLKKKNKQLKDEMDVLKNKLTNISISDVPSDICKWSDKTSFTTNTPVNPQLASVYSDSNYSNSTASTNDT